MLKPSECFAGPISDAETMSLVLPRNPHERLTLVVAATGRKHAVCLEGVRHEPFMAFACDENDAWVGLHVPDVAIELDESSLVDTDGYVAPLGSMIRSGDKLLLMVRGDHSLMMRGGMRLPILEGLPKCADGREACFGRWQIVLGEGEGKQVLHRTDVAKLATK